MASVNSSTNVNCCGVKNLLARLGSIDLRLREDGLFTCLASIGWGTMAALTASCKSFRLVLETLRLFIPFLFIRILPVIPDYNHLTKAAFFATSTAPRTV